MATTVSTIVYELKQQGIEVSQTAVRDYIKRKGIKKEGRFIKDADKWDIIKYYKLKKS